MASSSTGTVPDLGDMSIASSCSADGSSVRSGSRRSKVPSHEAMLSRGGWGVWGKTSSGARLMRGDLSWEQSRAEVSTAPDAASSMQRASADLSYLVRELRQAGLRYPASFHFSSTDSLSHAAPLRVRWRVFLFLYVASRPPPPSSPGCHNRTHPPSVSCPVLIPRSPVWLSLEHLMEISAASWALFRSSFIHLIIFYCSIQFFHMHNIVRLLERLTGYVTRVDESLYTHALDHIPRR